MVSFLNTFVNKDFKHSTHGKLGCTDCHGGNAKEADQRKAHLGMVSAESKCVNCHSEISKLHATSLHGTLSGMHCLDCHKNDMHGDGTVYTSRWNVKGRPQCTDCHDGLEKSQIPYRR